MSDTGHRWGLPKMRNTHVFFLIMPPKRLFFLRSYHVWNWLFEPTPVLRERVADARLAELPAALPTSSVGLPPPTRSSRRMHRLGKVAVAAIRIISNREIVRKEDIPNCWVKPSRPAAAQQTGCIVQVLVTEPVDSSDVHASTVSVARPRKNLDRAARACGWRPDATVANRWPTRIVLSREPRRCR